MSEKALIIVDMLNDFIDEKGVLYCGKEGEAIVSPIRARLAQARERGDLVVFVTDAHDEDDAEFRRYPRHAVAGTWGGEIVPDLAPGPGEPVICKRTLNSFHDTNLYQVLAESGARTVAVVGVCTSICVMDLVADLAARGYDITVPADSVADFDQEFHQFALRRMARVYGADVA